jgi:hypothetical protein
LKQAVTVTDNNKINTSGKWIQSVYDESLKQKVSDNDLAAMFSALSALPGTETGKYLDELAGFSDEAFSAYLKNLNLGKAGIKNPNTLLLYLLRNKDKGLYPADALFDALAKLIVSRDLPADSIISQIGIKEKPNLYILWIVVGAGLVLFIFLMWKRKKKGVKENDIK